MVQAVTDIVLTHARRLRKYICGWCDVAGLLLYVMARNGTVPLSDAESDAFWCFSVLMAEVEDTFQTSASAEQIHRVHELLRAYDPPVAKLLETHGLMNLPATRLGAALCTRAGFKLTAAVRLWDSLLADPERFEFVDYIVVALVLLRHGELTQHDDVNPQMGDLLIDSPNAFDTTTILRTAFAVCAFERRRHPEGTPNVVPFPIRPPPASNDVGAEGDMGRVVENLTAVASDAQTTLSSLWGLVQSTAGEALDQWGGVSEKRAAA